MLEKKDIPSALEFQIDSMHPYGEEPVAFGWAKADMNHAMVGIVRQATLDEYVAAFDQAGIAVAGFTFSASAIYSALRVFGTAPKDFAVVHDAGDGLLEIYGESAAKPVFSAEFDLAPARAIALAYSELRLTGKQPAQLDLALPIPLNVIQVNTLAYATALATLGRWNAPYANLLPPDRRTVKSRARFISECGSGPHASRGWGHVAGLCRHSRSTLPGGITNRNQQSAAQRGPRRCSGPPNGRTPRPHCPVGPISAAYARRCRNPGRAEPDHPHERMDD